MPLVNQQLPYMTQTDVSGTFTATGNSGAIESLGYASIDFFVNVTVASGTTPTLDLNFQTSIDGTNWSDIYDAGRYTTTGTFRSEGIGITGRYYRFLYTIAGTTPSFTFSVVTTLKSVESINKLSQVDFAAINLATLNSTSVSHLFESCRNVSVIVARAGGTGAATVSMQVSNDNVNFATFGSTATIGAASIVALSNSNIAFKFYRLIVTSAGVIAGTTDLRWTAN